VSSTVTVTQLPYAYSVRGRLTPHVVSVCRLYVQGYSMGQAAVLLGITTHSAQDAIKRCRAALGRRGHPVSNAIMLRKALRAEGYLDDIEPI
jgi:hypothetical protein